MMYLSETECLLDVKTFKYEHPFNIVNNTDNEREGKKNITKHIDHFNFKKFDFPFVVFARFR